MSLRKILIIFFLFSNSFSLSFAEMVTEVQNLTVGDGESKNINGVDFNTDGTKMFVLYQQQKDNSNTDPRFVDEYNLSTPFDISTASYAGDSERCELDDGTSDATKRRVFDLDFTKDGLSFFHSVGNAGSNDEDLQAIHRYDLTSPFDISTCSFASDTVNLNSDALQNGSLAGDHDGIKRNNRAQGVEINDDGTKLFVLMSDAANAGSSPDRILEYNFSTPFDLTTLSLRLDAGIEIPHATASNAMSIEFGADGKRLFLTGHNNYFVVQISLDKAFDTSSFTIDGKVNLNNISNTDQLRTVTFTNNGLRMFIGNDQSDGNPSGDNIFEFNLVCPFNIISGKCPSITENKDRTGIALAQIEIAKRTIDHSTDTALNRLKWIRRNKEKQNLTNLNIDFNFTNQRLASLTEIVKASAAKKKNKNKDEDVFYWSEGSIAVGRIGDTSISSTKKIGTDALTFGADKFTEDNGIKGLAFRVGRNNVDVGTAGSNLDTDTYNITFYSTTPIEDDTKFLDKIIGFGKLNSDLLTVQDGKNLTADRSGHQLYGTIRIKDEIKKDNLTFIPSGRFDIGHTILGSYEESGTGAIKVQKQHVRSKKIRAGLSAVEDISNDRYTIKRHGKIEYVADIDRSSNFKYTYVDDGSVDFNDTLHLEAFHNINGEIGIDIVLPDSFSIFLIYERNQAIDSGHTDKLHIAVGYLPNKETNFAFSIDGTDSMKSNYVFSKNINDYNIDLKLTNDLMRPEEYDEISFNLNRKF